jgi:hypothetical protein
MRASRSLGVIEAVQYMRYPVWPISGYFRSKRVGEDILDIYGGVLSVDVSKGYIGATVVTVSHSTVKTECPHSTVLIALYIFHHYIHQVSQQYHHSRNITKAIKRGC